MDQFQYPRQIIKIVNKLIHKKTLFNKTKIVTFPCIRRLKENIKIDNLEYLLYLCINVYKRLINFKIISQHYINADILKMQV